MAGVSRSDQLMSEINVTPLVDVMLVLLIIFMVTAPMMTQGVGIDLPETTAEAIETETEPLIVSINRDNEIFINEFKIGIEGFQEKLRRVLKSRKDKEVLLRADKEIPYGIVANLMAKIKGAGVTKLGMVTQPAAGETRDKKKQD